jgi:hypothetical protein
MADRVFTSLASVIKQFSVSVKLQEKNGSCWWFTGVYGPHQDNLKSSFLQELKEIKDTCVGPWIIGGDFNLIFREEDKNNSNINRAMLGDFHRLINSLDLKEIHLKGRRYTWSNQRDAPTLVKLDHVFCTSSWEDLFPDASLHSNATTSFFSKTQESCVSLY